MNGDNWRGVAVDEAPRNPFGLSLPSHAFVEPHPLSPLAGGFVAEHIVPEVPGRNRRERRANASRMRRER